MKCPACNKDLVEYTAGIFNVDICRDGCSGIWFDKGELEKCDQYNEPFPEDLLRVNKSPAVLIDRSKTRRCPGCGNPTMQRVLLDPETRFELDRCSSCFGHWLDNGELERMRKVSKADSELQARLLAFGKRVAEQLKKPGERERVAGFLKVLFR